MRRFFARATVPLVGLVLLACSSDGDAPATATPAPPTNTAAPEATATVAPTATVTPESTPTPTPEIVRRDIQATRLSIPAIGLDAEVQRSQIIPFVYVPEPGCPPGPEDTETLTVPNQGIATPEDLIEGLENKAWIFGHSRWVGVPGLFYRLQDLVIGDELFIDGIDRATGAPVTGERFVVDGFYLSDVDSGDTFLTAEGPEDIPEQPIVILQTSVRERGPGRSWILDQDGLLAKAQNIVAGDIHDPCRYLLLFVTASPG